MLGWSPIDVLPEILMDVPDLVFAYTCDGRYLFVNAAAAAFLGVKAMDVIGMHWQDLGFPAEVMQPLVAHVASVASSGRPDYYRAFGSAEKGNRVFDMALTPLWSDEGNVLAVLAIAHDITEFFPDRLESLS